jgi:mono/diheme cytochrome c family protein
MPYWALNAMTADDLRAIYQFIRSLGPKGVPAPADLAPGQTPTTPFVLFPGAQ